MGLGAAVAALALVALAGGAPGARAAAGPPVPILLYHHIAAAPAGVKSPALWVSPGVFASQVRALRAAGYHAVTLGRLWDAWHGRGRLPRRPVVLTFDDGYADQVAAALPVLARARWPGVLNLALKFLPEMGGEPAVRQLLDAGWELDSHSSSHEDLRTIGPVRVRRQVEGSRARIRELFGVTPRFFCYPFGHVNGAVAGAVKRAGYLGATTTRAAFATPAKPFLLPRVQVSRGESGTDLLRRLRALRLRELHH
jgi:peptidoglycan/xylan/chitin deacetylase (PgdA/CDA1 family)